MNAEPGRKFGPYEIHSQIGGGGMGHVFRAWDARLHREVAIKVLNTEFTMPGMRERFLREARAASALTHPNICTIFDIGEQDGDPYLVMELLEGETLKQRIQNKAMSVQEIVSIGRETAEALGAAHSRGVVHRDIKPANIFLVEKPNGVPQAKVLDFGLAKIEGGMYGARQSRTTDLTTVGATVGTLAYMSPEQARGEPLDSRSDLFSLGVVLYEMATRHVPFQGATSALVFVQLLKHDPEPVRDWNHAVPRALEKIIFRLLAKDRESRFQTALEVEQALITAMEKGSGGWLRKARSAVPLVRSEDPTARNSSIGSRAINSFSSRQGLERSLSVPDGTPQPPAKALSTPHRSVSSQDQKRSSAESGLEDTSSEGKGSKVFVRPTAHVKQPEEEAEVFHAKTPSGSGPDAGPDEHPRSALRSAKLRWIGLTASVACLGAACFWVIHVRSAPSVLLGPADPLVVAEVENRTGNHAADRFLTEGLRIALAESPHLNLRDGQSYRSARRLVLTESPHEGDENSLIVSQQTAKRLGTRAFLYGSLTGSSPPFTLRVELRDTRSNEVLSAFEGQASGLQQVTASVDEVAREIRASAGEPAASIQRMIAPLASEATGNLAALQLYSDSQDQLAQGRPVAALIQLQQAVNLDPHFVQAYLLMAEVYWRSKAEKAAEDSARTALIVSDKALESTRLRAQAVYLLDATGDCLGAATLLQQILATHPRDRQATNLLIRTLLTRGRFNEALQFAQQAYADDPFDSDAYQEAQTALVSLDRFGAALQVNGLAQRLDLAKVEDSLFAAYLDGRQDIVEEISRNASTQHFDYRSGWAYGVYLDNTGQLQEGSANWKSSAEEAVEIGQLRSTGDFLLAQGAVNLALLGDCPAALALATAAGPTSGEGRRTLFNLGLSNALCSEPERANEIASTLEHAYPKSFEVNGFFLADIRGTLALRRHDYASAMSAFEQARPYDSISPTPFLRALARIGEGKTGMGIVDLQTVLAHRGSAVAGGSSIYPASQLALARAFASTGDLSNSAAAYREFLLQWRNADPGNSLIEEATRFAEN